MIILQASASPGPDNTAYVAVLESGEASNLPNGIQLNRSLVSVHGGKFSFIVANDTEQDVLLPGHTCIGTLYNGELITPEDETHKYNMKHNPVNCAPVSTSDKNATPSLPHALKLGDQLSHEKVSKF